MIQITLDELGETVTLKLASYLGGDRFKAYRDVCFQHGARYVPSEKVNRLPLSEVTAAVTDLEQADLPVTVDLSVLERIREMAREAEADLEAGRSRLAAAEERLAESGLSLFPFQRTGVEWLAPRTSAVLCDQMGLGKTVQALVALPDEPAAMVVVPAAVRFSWERECLRWRPDLDPVVITCSAQFRWPVAGELVIVTYGMLPKTEDAIPGAPEIGTVLMADEAHALKNSKAKRTKAFREMVAHVIDHRGRVWLITGTPLLNRPPELWSLLRTARIAEEAFGNWFSFVRIFNGRKGRWGYEWGRPTEEAPLALRRVSLHRRREEVLKDLPGKMRRDLPVNGLDQATIALCDEVLAILKEKGIDFRRAAQDAEETKITGAAFEKLSAARSALATAKIPALLDLVADYEETETPVVVFSAHRAPIDALAARDGWAVITGSTSADERGRIVEEFQDGRLKGIAGTIGAMGVGVTLTEAHHVLFVDLAWTPALNCQAEDRVCRIGQKAEGVQIVRLVARHALDERVLELLTIKQEIIEASVEASAVESDYTGVSPAEGLARDARALLDKTDDIEAANERARAKAEKEREANLARVKAELGEQWDGRELEVGGMCRGPANAVEDHAAEAMLQLAGMDPDYAAERNNVGFSRYDGDFGHSLADQLRRRRMLSEKQWAAAVKLAHRYRRQVGEAPAEKVSA